MRNFEERKAEVFRRSEKRIKERKQRRNHILMACIPLVLCITILGAFLRPNVTPDGAADPGDTRPVVDGMGDPIQSPSLTCPIASITVSGNGFSQSYSEVEDLLLISDLLYSYGTRAPESNEIIDEAVPGEGEDRKDHTDDMSGIISDTTNAPYTITMVSHEGVKTEYQLSGNTLKNLTTNQTYTLSQTQVDELQKLLGILPQ